MSRHYSSDYIAPNEMSHHYEHESFKEHSEKHESAKDNEELIPKAEDLIVLKMIDYTKARNSFVASVALLIIFTITGIIVSYGDDKNKGGLSIFSIGLVSAIIIIVVYFATRKSTDTGRYWTLIDYEKHHQHKGHAQARQEQHKQMAREHEYAPPHNHKSHQSDSHHYNHHGHNNDKHNLFAHHL